MYLNVAVASNSTLVGVQCLSGAGPVSEVCVLLLPL